MVVGSLVIGNHGSRQSSVLSLRTRAARGSKNNVIGGLKLSSSVLGGAPRSYRGRPLSFQRLICIGVTLVVGIVNVLAAEHGYPSPLQSSERPLLLRKSSLVGFRSQSSGSLLTTNRWLQTTNTSSSNGTATCTKSCCLDLLGSTNSTACLDEEEEKSGSVLPPVLNYMIIAVLLMLSALFSGLTLGFMSLSLSQLEIIIQGSTNENDGAVQTKENKRTAQYAKNIYPIRKNGNLLLTTLVWSNVAINR
jgi:Cyclin M transmembrane N-terminal domain